MWLLEGVDAPSQLHGCSQVYMCVLAVETLGRRGKVSGYSECLC